MKIQTSNNISHKAYFKPNREFKKLWAIKPHNTEIYLSKLKKVKNELPNHQLEIIDAGTTLIEEKLKYYYLIFNNLTSKAFGVEVAADSERNHFVEILDSLLEKNEKTDNFFQISNESYNFMHITC